MRAQRWFLAFGIVATLCAIATQAGAQLPAPQAAQPGTEPQAIVSTRDTTNLASLSPCLDLLDAGAGGSDAQAYRVQRGDTLSGIAGRFYRSAAAYESIAKYHNAHRLPADHPAIPTETYIIRTGGTLRMPPRANVAEASSYVPPANVSADNRDFEVPGSGSVYPLVVTAANCIVHADRVRIPGAAPYRGAIRVVGSGTGFGRDEFCKHSAPAYMASDRAAYNLVTECQKPQTNRSHLEIAIARDAVVVVINRALVRSDPSFDTRSNPGYVTMRAAAACALLSDTAGHWRGAHRYLSTKKSGTLHFVGRRLCDDEARLASDALEADRQRTEKYDDLAFQIAEDGRGVGYLPYAFYYAQRDRLLPVAINGVPPILELATPDLNPAHTCDQVARSSYCLSRYLWLYVDAGELRRRGGLYRLLHIMLAAPVLIERAHYLPLNVEMRQGELTRLETAK